MMRGTRGTFRYVYPSSTRVQKVRLGTPPFRGVPSVPNRTECHSLVKNNFTPTTTQTESKK